MILETIEIPCCFCSGLGYAEASYLDMNGNKHVYIYSCHRCNGTGKIEALHEKSAYGEYTYPLTNVASFEII